jgi:hypothetical protein
MFKNDESENQEVNINVCKRRTNFVIQKGLFRQLITSSSFSSSIIEDVFYAFLVEFCKINKMKRQKKYKN